MRPAFSLPETFAAEIEPLLQSIGFSLTKPRALAEAILRQSQFYIDHPEKETPWREPWAQAAQLSYYLPLNYLRCLAAAIEGKRWNFFSGLTSILDFGSGLGAMTRALKAAHVLPSDQVVHIERSEVAQHLHQRFGKSATETWQFAHKGSSSQLATFSYALTELRDLPPFVYECEALCIVEPGTGADSRALLLFREKLLAKGFYPWAPCTHAQSCPLLMHSKTDWCHDRIVFAQPQWFTDIENFLPIKNRSLAFSYLLVRRSPPPDMGQDLLRLTGDAQEQKGRTLQMFCRGEKREFLQWNHRHGRAPDWPRGGLIRMEVPPAAATIVSVTPDLGAWLPTPLP